MGGVDGARRQDDGVPPIGVVRRPGHSVVIHVGVAGVGAIILLRLFLLDNNVVVGLGRFPQGVAGS